MKTKKPTKRDRWFDYAFFWGCEIGPYDCQGIWTKKMSDEVDGFEFARDEFNIMEYEERCFLRSQYCLERAGIPAGKP